MTSTATTTPHLAHRFDDADQQRLAATLGMWSFLATEVLFFGGMFAGYAVYRYLYLPEWDVASRELDLVAGTVNTMVLLTSSLTMALGVDAAKRGNNRAVQRFMLGAVFIGIKGYEYWHKWVEHFVPGPYFHWHDPSADVGPIELFFSFYFVMTGWHAIHMLIGFGLLATLWFQARRNLFSAAYYTPVEMVGLYWHFVDIIWVFLFPLLYLIDRT